MKKQWVLVIFVLILSLACEETDTSQLLIEYDYSYYPVDSGLWRNYSVVEINIDEVLDKYDTVEYFMREQLAGTFIDAAQDTMYKLNVFFTDSLHKPWILQFVWHCGYKQDEIIQIEENIKIIKQRLPLYVDKSWDGNAYNRTDTLNNFNYTIASIGLPETINNISFDSVLKVSHKELETLFDKHSYFEKYANGIGLIEKEKVFIYTQDADQSIPIERRAETATMYFQKIIDYGKAN